VNKKLDLHLLVGVEMPIQRRRQTSDFPLSLNVVDLRPQAQCAQWRRRWYGGNEVGRAGVGGGRGWGHSATELGGRGGGVDAKTWRCEQYTSIRMIRTGDLLSFNAGPVGSDRKPERRASQFDLQLTRERKFISNTRRNMPVLLQTVSNMRLRKPAGEAID
jgi:hypothetical protein